MLDSSGISMGNEFASVSGIGHGTVSPPKRPLTRSTRTDWYLSSDSRISSSGTESGSGKIAGTHRPTDAV